jgi:hypothetical protein
MEDDWANWPIPHPGSPAGWAFDWSSTGIPHPDSPAAKTFDWSSVDVPHPNSPVGLLSDWQSQLVRSDTHRKERQELETQIVDFERLLAEQVSVLRTSLPDASLQAIYDRQIGTMRSSSGSHKRPVQSGRVATYDTKTFLRLLQIPPRWFDVDLDAMSPRLKLRELVGNGRLVCGFESHNSELLNTIRLAVKRVYEASTSCVQKQWADARRLGKQQELIERWKRQMLQPRTGYSSPGIDGTESEVEGQRRLADRPETRSAPPSRTSAATKTWIEFQLIDEDGKPVPNASYSVRLPDGSIQNGTLNSQGVVRFDNIDPGQCQITFPRIDAREWHEI